jgi:chorismate mutase
MSAGELETCREQIDVIDNGLVDNLAVLDSPEASKTTKFWALIVGNLLLLQRFEVTEQVGLFKARHDLPARDESREAEKIASLRLRANEKGLSPDVVPLVWPAIMGLAANRHEKIRQELQATAA